MERKKRLIFKLIIQNFYYEKLQKEKELYNESPEPIIQINIATNILLSLSHFFNTFS